MPAPYAFPHPLVKCPISSTSRQSPGCIAKIVGGVGGGGGFASAALEGLLTHLRPHRDRMWYKDRLAAGLPIGSGLIEGGCKNVIGARLKLNNARWRTRRAERIGTLRCLDASGHWDHFWKPAA